MLFQKDIKIEDLILDPNNPRFTNNFDVNNDKIVPDDKLIHSEIKTLQKFNLNKPRSGEEFTNTHDLYLSMLDIGFVAIDQVVVKEISNTSKYLVIEGNRRISTVKKLLMLLKDNSNADLKTRQKIEKHLSSFEEIPCKVIITKDKEPEQISNYISIILGLRHHGSLLEWEPLPRAYNIYSEYMNLDGVTKTEFKIDKKSIDEVSARLSIPETKVRKALKTYIAYMQLCKSYPSVKDKHYSLIEAAVTNSYLSRFYIKIDSLSYNLDDESILRIDELCQFDTRDDNKYEGIKIISDPKQINSFANLIKRMNEQESEHKKKYIEDQIENVLTEKTSLDDANDKIIAFLNKAEWVETTKKLLTKQCKKLDFNEYTGSGNERAEREEVSKKLKSIRAFIKVL